MKIFYNLAVGFMVISVCCTQQSAIGADAQTDYETGFRYYKSKDYAETRKWWRKAADQGHEKAQEFLGAMYYFGQGVPKDYAEALKWYIRSADQGNTQAQKGLGYMYFNGQGVSKNLAEAKSWYGKAAAQGDEDALKMIKKLTVMGF